MEVVISFLVAVLAGVACHCIIKWLDSDDKCNNEPSTAPIRKIWEAEATYCKACQHRSQPEDSERRIPCPLADVTLPTLFAAVLALAQCRCLQTSILVRMQYIGDCAAGRWSVKII